MNSLPSLCHTFIQLQPAQLILRSGLLPVIILKIGNLSFDAGAHFFTLMALTLYQHFNKKIALILPHD